MDPTEPPLPHDPAPDAAALPPGALAGALLDASDRLNTQLMRRLEARGWPPLTRSRSLLFRHLGAGVDRPARLARALDITRQSMQKLLEGLEAEGLVSRVPDPQDARAQRVRLTAHGWRMVEDAELVLRGLEDELAARIGEDRLQALRSAMALLLTDATVAPTARGADRHAG
jgi:DNA-binding MarR family transcriptional regulator